MSDSIKKYNEIIGITTEELSLNQRQVEIICQIIKASTKCKMTKHLLKKVAKLSKQAPHLTPATAFQIAGDDLKIEELCGEYSIKDGTTKS